MKLCANWQESSSVKGLEGNPKFQARNSKQAQKFQNPNVPNQTFLNLEFWIWDLFRISIFGFRIFQCTFWVPATPG
jgi:hypothetical protein